MNDTQLDCKPIELNDHRVSLLLIDDDVKYCRLVSEYLTGHGFDITLAHNGKAGLEQALAQHFDAVILDIMLPSISGYELLKSIRERSEVPVLMLTALGEETDRIVGLELGADDYMPKSFSPREMLARIRAVLRRYKRASSTSNSPDTIVIGPLSVQPSSRKVTLDGSPVQLTAVEFDLLLCLAQAKGRIKTREQLLNETGSANFESYDRTIDVHISQLRKKLKDDAKNPRLIKTIRSIGYSLVDPDEGLN